MIDSSIIKTNHKRSKFSIHLIDLGNGCEYSYQEKLFLYPASLYKIFIGAEVLRQVEEGSLALTQTVTVKKPNDADNEAHRYSTDLYPILKASMNVEIDMLLTLMLKRSDNTASNVLIDVVGRESIIKNIIHRYGWHGSEVTRKFLNRSLEPKNYSEAQTTLNCAQHVAEFFKRVETDTLVSPYVSGKLRHYMKNCNENHQASSDAQIIYGKGGSLDINANSLLTSIRQYVRHRGFIGYRSYGGVLEHKNRRVAFSIISQQRVRRRQHTIEPLNSIAELIKTLEV